jgi:hypothetical protein
VPRYETPNDVVAYIQALEHRIQALERRTTRHMTVNSLDEINNRIALTVDPVPQIKLYYVTGGVTKTLTLSADTGVTSGTE